MGKIAYIKGELVEKDPSRAILEAGGVGYELQISVSTFAELPREGTVTKMLVEHVIREDDEILFGFASAEEKTMFQKLVSVSGVGPKIALAILSGASLGELSLAIANGESKRISAIKGVGRKTAEKICVELKDQVNALAGFVASGRKGGGGAENAALRDAILALSALGFAEEMASKLVTQAVAAHPEAQKTEDLVRYALAARG